MSDLKPCPFCGGEVNFWTRQARGMGEYQALIIECKDCSANMEEWVYKHDKNFVENFEKKKTEMLEAWNRRVERTAKALSRELDAVVKLEEGGVTFTYDKGTSILHECESCGTFVKPGEIYCHNCGARLEWE